MEKEKQDSLWKQYSMEVDMYKFHMEIVLKYSTFFFAISGAIFSYYFTNSTIENLKWVMLIPFVMGSGLVSAGCFAVSGLKVSRGHISNLANQLDIAVFPETSILATFLFIFIASCFLVSAAAMVVMIRP